MTKKGRIGPSFDDFLKEEGIHAEVTARAIRRVTAQRALARKSRVGRTNPRKKKQ